jgi:hypothetical protein
VGVLSPYTGLFNLDSLFTGYLFLKNRADLLACGSKKDASDKPEMAAF